MQKIKILEYKNRYLLLFLLTFSNLLITNSSIAGIENNFAEQEQCTWSKATYESKSDGDRFCILNNGTIIRIRENGYKDVQSGSLNRTYKSSSSYYSSVEITKWRIEKKQLIKYRCSGFARKSNFDCSGKISRIIIGNKRNWEKERELKNINTVKLFLDQATKLLFEEKYVLSDMNLNKALELDNKNKYSYLAYFIKGRIKIEQKDYQAGLINFNKSIKLNPKMALSYKLRGDLKLYMGKFKDALADYNKAFEIAYLANYEPSASGYTHRGIPLDNYNLYIPKLYNNKAYAKNKLGQYNSAINNINRGIELVEDLEERGFKGKELKAALFKNRGESFLGLGKAKKACSDWRLSVSLGNEIASRNFNNTCL